jgi:hypothetical protein
LEGLGKIFLGIFEEGYKILKKNFFRPSGSENPVTPALKAVFVCEDA